MRIDLTNYNATPTSTFRIYRSYETFTENKLPPLLAEIPATATEYLDNTVELNRLAYYRISVVHNASEIVGPLYITMKKYYTGPQVDPARSEPDTILRGDARAGRYGTLPMAAVYPSSQIPEDFPTLTVIEGVDVDATNVEKCILGDRILFISDEPMYLGSLEDLYNVGMLFNNGDGDGKSRMTTELYDSITTKVQQGKLIHANGFTYRPRLITESEFQQIYTKLYPSSVLGGRQECVIANCIPHTREMILLPTAKVGATGNITGNLNGTMSVTDWVSKRPLLLILELVSRSDSAFPDVDGEIKPTLPEDRMMYCGGELVNGRVHFFGGIYSTFTEGMEATTRHISFDLNGEDEQVHAPMPVGVYKQITWTHNNKIYSFGGVKKIGNTEWSYQELYNDVQVWEDDGTPEGKWTILTSNATYGFDGCGTVYYDSALDKTLILVFGGYTQIQPGVPNRYFYADVDTFDGTFTQAPSYMTGYAGGAALTTYDGYMFEVAGTYAPNGYTNGARRQKLPINPPSALYMQEVVTQGTELPPTKGGKLHTWRDTLLFVTEKSFSTTTEQFFIYQWAPNESRWLQIIVNIPGYGTDRRARGTAVFNGNRVYVLASQPWLNESFVSKLLVIDLIDPLDAPLKSINEITPIVDRLYPPFAKTVKP